MWVYFICINVITLAFFGLDKYKAIKDQFRIPEKTLLLLCVLGGSIGGLVGMFLFHHKIRKVKFYIGVPTILFLQILGYAYLVGVLQ